jgi:hypothetical protein
VGDLPTAAANSRGERASRSLRLIDAGSRAARDRVCARWLRDLFSFTAFHSMHRLRVVNQTAGDKLRGSQRISVTAISSSIFGLRNVMNVLGFF